MDDAKVASAQVWPRRPVDCEQLFFYRQEMREGWTAARRSRILLCSKKRPNH